MSQPLALHECAPTFTSNVAHTSSETRSLGAYRQAHNRSEDSDMADRATHRDHAESRELPDIILITGAMAAGKSTVAQAIAERLSPSVHLRGDVFRRMIVNGRAAMTADLSPAAYRQLRLRYAIAAAAAKLYVAAGFTVVYQDIIIGPVLQDVVQVYRGHTLAVIVLCPDARVLAARDRARGKTAYADTAAVETFDRVLRTETPRIGYWLNTSELTIPETVDAIIAQLPHAAIVDPLTLS
jgi:predicted kinase